MTSWSALCSQPTGIYLKTLLVVSSVPAIGFATLSSPTHCSLGDMAVDQGLEQNLTRFVELAATTAPEINKSTPSAPAVRRLGNLWAIEFKIGLLKPMVDQNFQDSVDQGVKAEVFKIGLQLSASLRSMGDAELGLHQPDLAAKDFLSAFEVDASLRYSDLTGLILMSSHDRFVLDGLSRAVREGSEDTREMVRTELAFAKKPDSTLEALVNRDETNANQEADRRLSLDQPESQAASKFVRASQMRRVKYARRAEANQQDAVETLLTTCST